MSGALLLAAIIAALVIGACAARPGPAPGPQEQADALPDPGAVPPEVIINGAAYEVSAFVWLDETPGDSDRRLRASVRLFRSDGATVPEGVRLGRIRVVYPAASWETEIRDPGGTPRSGELAGIATGGPEIPIDTRVAVVVEIMAEGTSHYVRAPDDVVRVTG